MYPKRIFLVRHGECEANVDKKLFNIKPDYAMRLTIKGIAQSNRVGQYLKDIIKDESVVFHCSPYRRTRETIKEILKHFSKKYSYREDPRLREHELYASLGDRDRYKEIEKADEYGVFFYRFPTGESCADVYDRISSWGQDLREEFKRDGFEENLVVIGHGMTNRIILMRLLGLSIEEFELLKNPENGECFILEFNGRKYKLINKAKKRKAPKSLFSVFSA